MDENDDTKGEWLVLGAIIAMIAFLLVKHTGIEDGQINPVYWAGVATPLLSQIAKKMFNLKKSNGK